MKLKGSQGSANGQTPDILFLVMNPFQFILKPILNSLFFTHGAKGHLGGHEPFENTLFVAECGVIFEKGKIVGL